jgi:transcriptional regulator with PAS, ATPase and Fis domain
MRAAVAALVGVLVLLLTACGGGGGSDARLSKEEFQSQANAICDKYQKQLDQLKTPTNLEEIPDLVDQALAILNKEVDEISALNPPQELQSQFDQLIAASDKTKEAADDLSAAAKSGDQAAVQKALEQGNAASKQADVLAGELGLDSCEG